MMAAAATLNGLRRKRPEWGSWLAVIEEVLRETASPEWEAAVAASAHAARHAVPLLAGATVAVDTNSVGRLLKRLVRIASHIGTPKMATLEAALDADIDLLRLFNASLCQDIGNIDEVAAASGTDADALQAVAGLLPVPFLHACNRRWAPSLPGSWVEGFCPVCGAWPTFAEVRGIERSRYFRCARCGGEWHARALHCPYCDTSDHDQLVSLVAENGDSNATIDACRHCLRYVKTLTRLQGCPPDTVMIEDLGTVDLDVAALQCGYTRPSGTGHPLEITVTDKGATRRFFTWSL
jgi:FdhE protein